MVSAAAAAVVVAVVASTRQLLTYSTAVTNSQHGDGLVLARCLAPVARCPARKGQVERAAAFSLCDNDRECN